jgi:hypothetical protein
MEALYILGTVFGLSMLAGLNLYLTVFVTGLAIRLEWLTNYPKGLEVLADPVVLTVAGALLVIELLVDKCPYADNLWDSIHTVIRPVGGALLALGAAGELHPVAEVVAVLLGGSIAFTAHSAKAGARLLVNTSPEPFSNIAVSTGEDLVVLGGLWFTFQHPLIMLVVVGLFVLAFWYCAPKFFRMIKAQAIGIAHRFAARRKSAPAEEGWPTQLPAHAHGAWFTLRRGDEEVVFALPCFSGRMKSIGRHVRGCLLGTSAGRLFFIGKKNFRTRIHEVAVSNARVLDDPGAVFHRLTVKGADDQEVRLRFTRKFSPYVPQLMEWMRHPAGAGPVAARTSEPPPPQPAASVTGPA